MEQKEEAVGKPPTHQKNGAQTPLVKLNLGHKLPRLAGASRQRGLTSAVPCSVEGYSARGFSHSGRTSDKGP